MELSEPNLAVPFFTLKNNFSCDFLVRALFEF